MTAARCASLGCAALAALAVAAAGARGDTAPIADSPDLPWTDPQHQSSLEVLATRIASTIAGRAVTVRCEGDTDWRALVLRQGADPTAELGYVGVSFDSAGRLTSLATAAELAGQTICLPLKAFAVAATKPTKCRSAALVTATVKVPTRVRVRRTLVVGGRRRTTSIWVTRLVPTRVVKPGRFGAPAPCYPPAGRVQELGAAFWDDYDAYATAILTLAHESIHLGGVVGLRLANGTTAGDPLAEAKAQCYGMQWMPYVAEQLGDAPDDAQAIATYYWERVYPRYRQFERGEYWSADCAPGGARDLQVAGTAAWP
jgi:hypothetical protein